MTVVITEVIKRAKQGRSAPYVCRGDDGHIYFVKNRSLPRRELVAEYLCAGLAQALELPLAPWCVADVPPELVSTAMGTWMAELGAGPAFASRAVQATELSWHQAQVVDPRLQARVAAFDWWVLNMDRTLTDLGGNPNLLWAADDEQAHLVVIDHHMEIAPKSASHNAPAPLAPSISRQRTLHRKSSNFHRWGQMHVCHLAEH